jgi:hypothetical protein
MVELGVSNTRLVRRPVDDEVESTMLRCRADDSDAANVYVVWSSAIDDDAFTEPCLTRVQCACRWLERSLPPDWETATSTTTGETYFVNTVTDESTFDDPRPQKNVFVDNSDMVVFISVENGFTKVRTDDGEEGWLRSAYVHEIKRRRSSRLSSSSKEASGGGGGSTRGRMADMARMLGLWTGKGEDLHHYEKMLQNMTRKELQSEARSQGLKAGKASTSLIQDLILHRQQQDGAE